jgi:hypothetical protein
LFPWLAAGSFGELTDTVVWGCVLTVLAAGVTGKLKVIVLFGETLLKGPVVVQVITCKTVLHVVPTIGLNVEGAENPAGNVMVEVIGPLSGPVPLLVIVAGTRLGEPTTKGVKGCPRLIEIFGAGAAATFWVGVMLAVLLPWFAAGSLGELTEAVVIGALFTLTALGVTDKLNVFVLLPATLLKGPVVVQVITCPTVVQEVPTIGLNVPDVVLNPAGNVIVEVILPVSGAVPELVIVTGTKLAVPTTNGVKGCPSAIITFGAGVGATGTLGVIEEPLLPWLATGSLGVVVVTVVWGEVLSVDALGVTGIFKTIVLLPATLLNGVGVKQEITCPVAEHVEPFVKNSADVKNPAGNVIVVVIGLLAGAEPWLVTVTGIELNTPTVKVGVACPIAVIKSGTPVTAVFGVMFGAALLVWLAAGSFGALGVAVNGPGLVPTVEALAVTGISMVVLLLPTTLLKGPGLIHVTIWPLVVQVLPFVVNGPAGALVLAGNVIVVVIGPVAGAVPWLVTVTGTLLGEPATNEGDGCPITVTKSGAGAAVTAVFGVMFGAALLVWLATGSFGALGVAVNGPGLVPTVEALAVTGMSMVVLLLPATLLNGPGLVHVTVWPLVVQVLPFVVNGPAGALVLAGNVIVVVIGPVAGAVPWLVTVTGTLLGEPATNEGEGCPITVTKSGAGAAVTAVFGVMFGAALLVWLAAGSFGALGVAVNGPGLVPTVEALAVTGMSMVVLLLPTTLLNGPGLVHVTVWPLVVQVLPFVVNGPAGALVLAGNVIVVVIGPVAGAVPWLVTVTGTLLGEPATNEGEGCPITVTKSGAGAAVTAVFGVMFGAALLVWLAAGSFGALGVAVNGPGLVPTVEALAVTGMSMVVLLLPTTLLKGPGLVHVTVWPLVVQVLPFVVKGPAGALVLAGNVIVVVIGPVAGAVPWLVTVTGTLLGEPATNEGEGCPITVTKSGAGAAVTAVFGVMFGAALLVWLAAGSFGALGVAVNGPGLVPTVEALAVTGISMVVLLLPTTLLNGPGLVHVTVWPLVVQVLPFVVKGPAGALVLAGNVIVVVIGPVAGAVPWLVTVTGTLLGEPATNEGEGCPITVTKSGVPDTAVLGVIGVAGLLLTKEVGSFGELGVAVNGPGVLPIVPTVGVTGMSKTAVLLPATLLNGPGVVHVTTCPVVVQVEPLVVNGPAGALVPVGKLMVVVITPASGAEPVLVSVTGMLLGLLATKFGAGCPILEIILGEPTTGLGVIAGAALFVWLPAGSFGELTVALTGGVVPTTLAVGVTGTLKVVGVLIAKGPGLVHVTTWAATLHVQPLSV